MVEQRLVGQSLLDNLLELAPVFALDGNHPDPVVVKANQTKDQHRSTDKARYEAYAFCIAWKEENNKQPAGNRYKTLGQL